MGFLRLPTPVLRLFFLFSFRNRVFLLKAGIMLNIVPVQDDSDMKYFQSLHQIVVIRISEV